MERSGGPVGGVVVTRVTELESGRHFLHPYLRMPVEVDRVTAFANMVKVYFKAKGVEGHLVLGHDDHLEEVKQ